MMRRVHPQSKPPKSACAPHRARERGSIAVEFAISFPLLIGAFLAMFFLLDVLMVRQEVTNIGFSAMRHCRDDPDREGCVLRIINTTQQAANTSNRYSCNVLPHSPEIHLVKCTYEALNFLNTIFYFTGTDLSNALNVEVPVFFPRSTQDP
jgi:hypothetical protein